MAVFVIFHFCGAVTLVVLPVETWNLIINLYNDGAERHVPVQYHVQAADYVKKVYSASVATSVSLLCTQ